MDRLQAMSAFVAVVEHGGFAAAARALGVSAPVVTRAVAELEDRLGVRLLTRTTRVVRVTEAGERYAEDCRLALAAVEQADQVASGTQGVPRGRLVVTAPVLFGRLYLMPLLATFTAQFPHTTVDCMLVDRVVNLVEEGVDVAVRIGELPDSSLRAIPVGQVRRVVCAAPGYLARHGTPQTPQDLARHQIVVATGVSPTNEWRFDHEGRALSVRLQPRIRANSNDAALAAVLAGAGLTRLMSYQVAADLQAGRLERVLAAYEPAPLPVHVVHREGRHASPTVRACLDLCVAALRAEASLQ